MSRKCPVCSKEVGPDGVEGQVGHGPFYHPDCFVCGNCSTRLSGSHIADETGKHLLCDGCFDEMHPPCPKCCEPLLGVRVKVDQWGYHETCFTCVDCKTALSNTSYFGKTFTSWRCRGCEAKFAPLCTVCNNAIRSNRLTVGHRHYHEDCAFCVTCTKPLGTKSKGYLHRKYGFLQCGGCFEPKPAPKALAGAACQACRQPVGSDQVTTASYRYHFECFVCRECNKRIVFNFFAPADGKPICGSCTEAKVPKCAACGTGVVGLYKKVGGETLHNECFRCCDCGHQLDMKGYECAKGYRCNSCALEEEN